MSKKELSGSEAIYGFCGWLTTRKKVTKMSSVHDAGVIADLVVEFCKVNNLQEPRDKWIDNLIHPTSK